MTRLHASFRVTLTLVLLVGVTACGAPYRSTSLFHDRVISRQRLPAEDYAVYAAALLEFPPDRKPPHDWITVTGITIRPDEADTLALRVVHASVTEDMLSRLYAASDTVYLVEARFTEALNVVISPVLDTTDWVPVKWHRVRDRPHVAGLIGLSKVAFSGDGQTALVYGLWGTGTLGTGYPRVLVLRKTQGTWSILASLAPTSS